MTYKNKGPPKRSEGVLQTGICLYLIYQNTYHSIQVID